MAGINKVILVGNLGADPELKYTASGTAVAKFRIATSESFTDKSGQKQERTEWHRITAWSKLAEICGQYLAKGKQVYIEGKIKSDTWTQDGIKRYSYEIVAETMRMLGSPAGAVGGTANGDGQHEPPFDATPALNIQEDDIPF
jgi:single-strand DNA-binding protein